MVVNGDTLRQQHVLVARHAKLLVARLDDAPMAAFLDIEQLFSVKDSRTHRHKYTRSATVVLPSTVLS
jgi:hypothetical protein